jgi:type IV secretory pathway ATPase VirB11/archaellum biosynthesis ATPase
LNESSQAKKPIKKIHYDISEIEKDIDRILEKKSNTQTQKDTPTKENNNQNTFNQTASNTEEKSFPQSDTTKDSLYFIKKKEQQAEKKQENKEKSASEWLDEQFKKINTKPKAIKHEHKPPPKKVEKFFEGEIKADSQPAVDIKKPKENKPKYSPKEPATSNKKKFTNKLQKIKNIRIKNIKKTNIFSKHKEKNKKTILKEKKELPPSSNQDVKKSLKHQEKHNNRFNQLKTTQIDVSEKNIPNKPIQPKIKVDEFIKKTKENLANQPSDQSAEQNFDIQEITNDGQIQFTTEAEKLKTIVLQNLGYSQAKWEELDFYSLEEPYAYVQIIREKETLDKRYVLVEISLTQKETKIQEFIKETIKNFSMNTNELELKGEETCLIEQIHQIISDYNINMDEQTKKRVIYFLRKQFLGLDRIDAMMKDPQIEDISCDGAGVSFFVYHRRFGSLKSNIAFHDEEKLSNFVIKLAQKCGKHISIAEPMLDATMPDGSRLQATLSTEVTTKGSTFTIRKFKEDPFSPPDLIEFNTMSSEMVAYLWLAVENGINALVAGGTAAGKTSTLNAFSLFIPQESKIISIEETREINLPHPNWIPGVSRSGFGEVVGGKVVGEIDLYDLMKAALRQRPEYILVGEIRGREAYVLFQAMATGHTTYSTIHADSASSLIHRLEGKPINIPRIMIQSLDIVCIQVISRIKNKRARRCKQIIEIIDIDPTTKEILTNEVFKWDPVEDKFIYNGKSYILERIRADKDLSREKMVKEVKQRTELLEWMNTNNVRDFRKVSTLIARYTENPDQVIKKIKEGETK